MKIFKYLVLFLFTALCLPCRQVEAQQMGPGIGMRAGNQFGDRFFAYQLYNFADTTDFSASLVEFHFSVVNDLLTFLKTDSSTFKAEYEINIVFYDKKGHAVAEESFRNKTLVNSYAETNSRINPTQSKLTFSLPADEYYYIIQIIEHSIPEPLTEKTKITFRSFERDRLHLSDIVLCNKLHCVADTLRFEPNIKEFFFERASQVAAFCNIYPQENADRLLIDYKITDIHNQSVYSNKQSFRSWKKAIPFCLYMKDKITKSGQYFLTVTVKSGKQSVEMKKQFSVRLGGAITETDDPEIITEQLKLIAHKKTVQAIMEAPEAEKQQLIDSFWQERDPTPDTPQNELYDEFQNRIAFANQNFAESFPAREGWKTDRGEIYIKFGPPTQVERQQPEMGRPGVEIWYYTKTERRYVFADRTGNGEFRLVRIE